jgi:hypothetical protein
VPYKDPEKARKSAKERKRKYLDRRHAEKYGANAGDMRGRHGNHARGSKSHRWNEGRLIATNGYVLIRVGKNHPLADPNGYAKESLIVWVSAGNPHPKRGELLHHKSEDKTDDRIGNLRLKTKGKHNRHHNKRRVRDSAGRFLPKIAPCPSCGDIVGVCECI